MKRGVQRLSTHVPRPAPPISSRQLAGVVAYLTTAGPDARVMTAALLIGYATLLRQGNLLATDSPNDPAHYLRRADIDTSHQGLSVTVRSTKTRWRSSQPLYILVPPVPGSLVCPVLAWSRYLATNRPHPLGPAFILPSGRPLQAPTLLAVLRLALEATGSPAAGAYTLHSLRRGGAQACAAAGRTTEEIMKLGTWTSTAVHAYVPRDPAVSGPRTLQ